MKTLIIYEIIPEDTILSVVELTNNEYKYFSKAHNHIINSDEWSDEKTPIVNVIGQALCEDKGLITYCDNEKEREYFGKFTKGIVKGDNVSIGGTEKLIRCGVYT